MNEVYKILKDAAKITASCISPMDTFRRPCKRLASTAKTSPRTFVNIYEPSASLCLRDGKMVEFSGKQHRYDMQKFLQNCAKPA